MNNNIIENVIYSILISLFLRSANAIKIGNSTAAYRGNPVNVPDDIGIRKQNIAKIMYEK